MLLSLETKQLLHSMVARRFYSAVPLSISRLAFLSAFWQRRGDRRIPDLLGLCAFAFFRKGGLPVAWTRRQRQKHSASLFLELLGEYAVRLQIDSLMTRQESNNSQADLADRGAHSSS
jgi:hypothetical protein